MIIWTGVNVKSPTDNAETAVVLLTKTTYCTICNTWLNVRIIAKKKIHFFCMFQDWPANPLITVYQIAKVYSIPIPLLMGCCKVSGTKLNGLVFKNCLPSTTAFKERRTPCLSVANQEHVSKENKTPGKKWKKRMGDNLILSLVKK